MSNFTGEMLATLVPFLFVVAGTLAAGYRRLNRHNVTSSDTAGVDPDIRVRVTGKIS